MLQYTIRGILSRHGQLFPERSLIFGIFKEIVSLILFECHLNNYDAVLITFKACVILFCLIFWCFTGVPGISQIHTCIIELNSPFTCFGRKTVVLAEPCDRNSGRPEFFLQ
jgi:hypothetical protein